MRQMTIRRRWLTIPLVLAVACTAPAAGPVSDPLPSWQAGPTRDAIVQFVQHSVTPGDAGFIAAADRIAVFDNDGTLWSEQPMYFQAFFIFDRIRALAPEHPEWRDKEPFASVLRGDLNGALAGGEHALVERAGQLVARIAENPHHLAVLTEHERLEPLDDLVCAGLSLCKR